MRELIIFVAGIVFGRLIIELIDFLTSLLSVVLQDVQNEQALNVSKIQKEISEIEAYKEIYDEPNRIGFVVEDEYDDYDVEG